MVIQLLLYIEQQWRKKTSNKDIRYISGFIDTESSSLEKFNEQYLSLHLNILTLEHLQLPIILKKEY